LNANSVLRWFFKILITNCSCPVAEATFYLESDQINQWIDVANESKPALINWGFMA
jgi:hypothetical protein